MSYNNLHASMQEILFCSLPISMKHFCGKCVIIVITTIGDNYGELKCMWSESASKAIGLYCQCFQIVCTAGLYGACNTLACRIHA